MELWAWVRIATYSDSNSEATLKKFVAMLLALAGMLIFGAPANAAITSSQVTTPANNSFFDPDVDVPITPLLVEATTTGPNDPVDIVCAHGDDEQLVAQDVPVADGGFSYLVNLNDFDYYICRLLAVPANDAGPYDPSAFGGPVVGVGGFTRSFTPDDILFDYYQAASSPEGYWSVTSAGDCYLYDSYPVEPGTLDYDTALWGCSEILQGGPAPEPSFRVDGKNVLSPYEASSGVPGYRGLDSFQHGNSPTDGTLAVSESSVPVACAPDEATCTSYVDSGIRFDHKMTGGTIGHTMALRDRFTNTTAVAKELEITYEVDSDGAVPGWKFPGETVYTVQSDGVTVPAPPSGPASVFLLEEATKPCVDVVDACGSVSWYEPPQAISFSDDDELLFTYRRTIAPDSSEAIALEFSQGFPQSQVDGFAATAEAGFATAFTIGGPKLNKKKGRAVLPVTLPGPGTLGFTAKNVKPQLLNAPGNVAVQVKPTGKLKKKLKKRGKAKVTVSVTYTRADLDPVTQTKKLKLKQKKKKRRK